jgi:hypothetical protein
MFVLPGHQREVIFKERLVAGRISIREKEVLLDRFYRFLEAYTKQFQRPMKIKREDLKLTDPDAGYLYDIVSRILKRASIARVIPQVLDTILSTTLLGVPTKTETLIGLGIAAPNIDVVLKLTRDIVLPIFTSSQPTFIKRIASIQPTDFTFLEPPTTRPSKISVESSYSE